MSSTTAPNPALDPSSTVSAAAADDDEHIAEEDEEDAGDEAFTLVGTAEYQLVGIRYYRGVAHPGEMVELVREPHNPYDRNAIKVNNLRGEKIGHVKGTTAQRLAPLMDNRGLPLRFDGRIPRQGDHFKMPLALEIYADPGDCPHVLPSIADKVAKALKHTGAFRLSHEFGGGMAAKSCAVPEVTRVKMDWNTQQKALDEMFDKALSEQYKDLPELPKPPCLKDSVTLFDHQTKGIRWLYKRELEGKPAPFYRQTMENGREVYFCEITNSSQPQPPQPVRGSLLCDAMGLGKTLVVIGLILSAPPASRTYELPKAAATPDNQEPQTECACGDAEKQTIPVPGETSIRHASVAQLKSILKAAKLKVSGKKADLVGRVLDGTKSQNIRGEHFPEAMRRPPPNQTPKPPMVASSGSCTLIVCPVSVMSNWTHQLNTHVHAGVVSLDLYYGPNRRDLLPRIESGSIDVLLVSYHTLAAEYGAAFGGSGDGEESPKKKSKRTTIFDIGFHRIVLDEAHTIRNTRAKFFKAVRKIRADRKLALTGTPFVNRADDVHSLLSFLGVEPLNNKTIFTRAISQCIKNGDEIGLARLRACMGFVSLRRSHQNVDIRLVEKDVQLCRVEFGHDQHKTVYDALFGTLRVAMEAILNNNQDDGTRALKHYTSIFEKILRLRQACCSGTLISKHRRGIALEMWDDVRASATKKKLTAEEGLELLEKLKGAFSEEPGSLPECGICLTEMEESEGVILKKCGHVFRKSCIRQVLTKSNRKCPYCRVEFCESDIIDRSTAKFAADAPLGDEEKDDSTEDFGTPSKIRALLDAMKNMKPDEKGVIFSQFTKYLDQIGDALRKAGHTFVRIDGSVPAKKRIACIEEFNSDKAGSPRFILCSLLASGTGINLTRGNYAFMMDCWWNEAMEHQAMDRIHRINQTRKVTVLRFVMKDSIEERIVQLQEAKGMQAKGVLQKLKNDEKRKALLQDLRGLLQIEE